ncbi:MAG TPA: ATP-binding cassette domain-containing protein, partial [Bryobacteraceae bacterium]
MDTEQQTIGVKDVRKSFGEQVVLDRITFELNPGEVTCVLGRSGTGKSVLLKLLIGLEHVDSGTVQLAGQDITAGAQPALNEARK